VQGVSGRWYRLTNDFMSPHERHYGREPGAGYLTEPIVHGPCGVVFSERARDALAASCGRRLDAEVARAIGRDSHDPAAVAEHRRRIRAVLRAVHDGCRKRVLPQWASWLRAPGGHWYERGHPDAYDAQEPAIAVRAIYVERFFDEASGRLVVVHRAKVDAFSVRADT
jgi:hypothetical protein